MSRSLTTIDRILEASLRLFNEHGFQSVPAMKIAQHLKISPGHLAYHFKTKNDIVLALFPRLEEEMRQDVLEALVPGQPFSVADGAQHTIAVFRTLWRYRFIFESLNHLLSDDTALRQRYLVLQESIISTSERVFKQMILQKEMLPIRAPSTARSLATSWWLLWLGWLRVQQIERPDCEMPPDDTLFEGAMQTHGIIQAYFSPEFSTAFQREVRKAVAEHKNAPPPRSIRKATPPRSTRRKAKT